MGKRPMRAVVSREWGWNPSPALFGKAGEYRVERLECGHAWVGKGSIPLAKRRLCHECREAGER